MGHTHHKHDGETEERDGMADMKAVPWMLKGLLVVIIVGALGMFGYGVYIAVATAQLQQSANSALGSVNGALKTISAAGDLATLVTTAQTAATAAQAAQAAVPVGALQLGNDARVESDSTGGLHFVQSGGNPAIDIVDTGTAGNPQTTVTFSGFKNIFSVSAYTLDLQATKEGQPLMLLSNEDGSTTTIAYANQGLQVSNSGTGQTVPLVAAA